MENKTGEVNVENLSQWHGNNARLAGICV